MNSADDTNATTLLPIEKAETELSGESNILRHKVYQVFTNAVGFGNAQP
jgi:hypothetical protein